MEKPKTCVRIEAIKEIQQTINHINNLNISEIEWVDETGKKISVDAELITAFKMLGRNNIDFIEQVLEASPEKHAELRALVKKCEPWL